MTKFTYTFFCCSKILILFSSSWSSRILSSKLFFHQGLQCAGWADFFLIQDKATVMEFEAFIGFLKNADIYYAKANYVQKRKIASILISNIKISPE